jgi:hypothetical protein
MESAAAAAARPEEEEARRRRSTDCIYFLASPLTCNKVRMLISFFSFFFTRRHQDRGNGSIHRLLADRFLFISSELQLAPFLSSSNNY